MMRSRFGVDAVCYKATTVNNGMFLLMIQTSIISFGRVTVLGLAGLAWRIALLGCCTD